MGWTGRPIGSNEHFMGGDKDFNLPLAGGEQLYQALKSVDTPAELVVCPGEFHTFTRPSFIKDRYQRWFEWYDKYVAKLVKLQPISPVFVLGTELPAYWTC
jgi:hypothetical protein